MSNMTKSTNWFDVDRQGLSQILQRRGKAWAVFELIQNSWDADGSTAVTATIEAIANSPKVRLTVEDNAPDGFADLTHAFTLFAPSTKKAIATKRGRFNVGCKLVLALCTEAEVTSTTGAYRFDADGRRPFRGKRGSGSIFKGVLNMTRAELVEVRAQAELLRRPADVTTTFTFIDVEGVEDHFYLPIATIRKSFTASLVTEVAGADGGLERRPRKAAVDIADAGDGTQAYLYELGLPVSPIDGPWHVDVQQKIPQGLDRDAVSPKYITDLQALVLNQAANLMPDAAFTAPWVVEAVQQPNVEPAAVSRYLDAKYGEKRVVSVPGQAESDREAIAAGYAVIHGRSEASPTWGVIKDNKLAPLATQLFPPPGVGPSVAVPVSELPDGYLHGIIYAAELAQRLLGVELTVRVIDGPTLTCLATWRRGEHPVLTLNRSTLGAAWFEYGPTVEVNDLLIHELAHQAGDHLSKAFDDAMSLLGARMVDLALRDPAFFTKFFPGGVK